MRSVAALIIEITGGELSGFSDVYLWPQEQKPVSVSLERINDVLGTTLSVEDVDDAFTRLNLHIEKKAYEFTVVPPPRETRYRHP